jgi:hypothetical protein
MFTNSTLKTHLESSSTIKTESVIIAEWNLNNAENIEKIGNYRHRPTLSTKTESNFGVVASTYDVNDTLGAYTGATTSDIVLDGGYNNVGSKEDYLVTSDQKMQSLFSLEQCFDRFRPRSGINKVLYFDNRVLPPFNPDMFSRPRYYFAGKDDNFKYWTSARGESDGTSSEKQRGISRNPLNYGTYYIDDAAPFIKYTNAISTNRIVVKMQTHTSQINAGNFIIKGKTAADPFYEGGSGQNKKVPKVWKIQYLDALTNVWTDAYSFNGSSLVNSDGYTELAYGMTNKPEGFIYVQTVSSVDALPDISIEGYAYLVKSNSTDQGVFYVWNGVDYDTFVPQYGWTLLSTEDVSINTPYVTDFTNPDYYVAGVERVYREFQRILGLRIVVTTMNTNQSSFDLIELSPRLATNITDITESFSVKKSASDLGLSGLPVGQLIAGEGKINLFDYDQSFNPNNAYDYNSGNGSIVATLSTKNIQFKMYQVVKDVDGLDYYIPQKTVYSDIFPQYNSKTRQISIAARDLFFFLESKECNNLLITNGSLSYIVGCILDSIGYSNFAFYRDSFTKDFVVPYFFVAPKTTVAQALQDLARASQTAMFFDEYNNFIVMSKEYLMPDTVANGGRATAITLYGTKDFAKSTEDAYSDGIKNNVSSNPSNLTNIVDIASQSSDVYNDGRISYTTRNVLRAPSDPLAESLSDREISWVYQPTKLWEISGDTLTKDRGNQSEYTLNAMPLNSDLSTTLPNYSGGVVVNNVMDFGENIFWQSLNRYSGYFYANGEIIKYDAIQYDVAGTGKVWITSQAEYEDYKNNLEFLGKMYATGVVRIYSEVKDGVVVKHGRGQFGTTPVYHSAKTSRSASSNPQTRVFVNDWTDQSFISGCNMDSAYLFEALAPIAAITNQSSGLQASSTSGLTSAAKAKTAQINTIIKNPFIADSKNETSKQAKELGTQAVSASALVLNGPTFTSQEVLAKDFITYSYKNLGKPYQHVGTRVRIIGTIKSQESGSQVAYGAMPYFNLTGETAELPILSGGSAGLGIMTNPTTNTGYYFELAALSEDNIKDYSAGNVATVFFYKLNRNPLNGGENSQATPTVLYRGLYSILTDSGDFYGAGTIPTDKEEPRVYDIAVEYEKVNNKFYRFYLYINNSLIATVEDKDFLQGTNTNNISLFVRGTSRAMFENVYAITPTNTKKKFELIKHKNKNFSKTFTSDGSFSNSESLSGYGISELIQTTFLGTVSTKGPEYSLYYEEFGTIMRECSYLNIKFDKAYPSLLSKVVLPFNNSSYTISGFTANPYGAEFMIFNHTDRPISIGSGTFNPLTILGLTLTNDTQNDLTVDDYFAKRSDLSDTEFVPDSLFNNPSLARNSYIDIKNSRTTYGRKDFSLDSIYIQTHDAANNIMGWIVKKIMRPRRSVGIEVFGLPTLQLGDIVEIEYDVDGINQIAAEDTRFVVYSIENNVDSNGPVMNVYLSEVI